MLDMMFENNIRDILNQHNIKDISINSDVISYDSCFFALKGSRFDGNDFIQTAFNNGAKIVHAIEPEIMDQSLFDKEKGCIQFAFDITKDPLPKEIEEMQYDLVYSIEVMEHIELEYHSQIFDFLTSKSTNIVFSGARVGQAGTGHIACRPEEEWRQEFLDRGFTFLEDLTQEIRQASNKRNTNHIRNLQVFKKL